MSANSSTVTRPLVTLEVARTYIQQLDLSYIIAAMCAPGYMLPQWELAEAQHCCALYKNFLWLNKKHLPEFLVPTREIDEFWHNHILYTQRYFYDCKQIFGFYFHHVPTSPDDDPQHLIDGYQKTKQLYLEEFRQPLNLLKP